MRTIMAGLAEFERDLIRERVKSSLAGAKSASALILLQTPLSTADQNFSGLLMRFLGEGPHFPVTNTPVTSVASLETHLSAIAITSVF